MELVRHRVRNIVLIVFKNVFESVLNGNARFEKLIFAKSDTEKKFDSILIT